MLGSRQLELEKKLAGIGEDVERGRGAGAVA